MRSRRTLSAEAKVPRAMVDPITNLKTIERDHGHYVLLPQGVSEHYASTVNPQASLKPIHMADIPAVNFYLMRNRRVSTHWTRDSMPACEPPPRFRPYRD